MLSIYPYGDVMTEEEEFEYMLSLGEMTTVGRCQEFKLLIQVHPKEDYTGESYFKLYNNTSDTSATKMARIRFDLPLYVVHAPKWNRGKDYWWLNSRDKRNLIQYLDAMSNSDPRYTNWQYAILQFNNEKGLDFPETEKNLLSSKKLLYPDFLPFDLPRPDYTKLPANKKKNEQAKKELERSRRPVPAQ